MPYEKVEVLTRDEYAEAQEPRRIVWQGRVFHVTVVVDRWYEGYLDATRLPLRYYRVDTVEGRQFVVRYHAFFRAWSILVTEGD